MANQETRSPVTGNTSKVKEGILLAKVVGFLDPSFMCGLEVTLLDESGNTIGDINQTYPVKYASPFYGATAFENMGLNKTDSNDSQKSYGMWFPTPEIGTTILVAFVNGNTADGYFLACVPGRFMNHMIPAIAGSTAVELTAEQKKKYDTTNPLPVTEVNRKTNTDDKALEIEKIKKPVHPIADAFLRQGVLEDDVRGVTTSTSRRNVPNTVFGISTPGPADRRAGAKFQFIGKKQSKSEKPVPVSRLGGTTMVFDDGDDQYLRKGPASTTAYKYIDVLDKKVTEKGDVNIPYNEYFRIRTRTGHQLLMHNSEDLIYIGNAGGTSWIEMTANGKIDIYAEDSVSIHTRADFNFRADRDINLEAARNINMRSGGRWHADIGSTLEFAVGGKASVTVGANLEILVSSTSKLTSGADCNISTGGSNLFSAGGNTNIGSAGDHIESAAAIHMNGPAAEAATDAAPVTPLTLHPNPNRSSSSTWGDKKRYKAGTLQSIMKRIPMHEPWEFHENNAPKSFIPKNTDRDA